MITIRPESEGVVLVVEASEKLTANDYEAIFIPKLDELIQKFGKLRVVFYFNEDFRGWEFGAMWDDAKFGLQHKNDFEKIAMVGGPRWAKWIAEVGAHFMPGEINDFEIGSLQHAIAWIKQ